MLVLGLLLAAGCKGGSATPIGTLLDDPGRYDGKTVRIAGDVTESFGLLGYGGYRVKDDTGQIAVVTKTGGAPREGAKVGVQGTFRSGFTLGTQTVAVIEEDKRFEP
jgi:hypothetical protein